MAHFPEVTGSFYFTKRLGLIRGLFIQKLLCKLPEEVMTKPLDFTHLGALLGKRGGLLETTVLYSRAPS